MPLKFSPKIRYSTGISFLKSGLVKISYFAWIRIKKSKEKPANNTSFKIFASLFFIYFGLFQGSFPDNCIKGADEQYR